MIKGCERRMIKIENTESELFESAYFIIRQNAPLPKKTRREDIMREAARIVGDKMEPQKRLRRERRRMWIERGIVFGVGVITAAVCAVVIAALARG